MHVSSSVDQEGLQAMTLYEQWAYLNPNLCFEVSFATKENRTSWIHGWLQNWGKVSTRWYWYILLTKNVGRYLKNDKNLKISLKDFQPAKQGIDWASEWLTENFKSMIPQPYKQKRWKERFSLRMEILINEELLLRHLKKMK